MTETNKKGYITELQVISKLLEYGDVSIPYGNNSRYDCILDYNGKLLKIQIKTARKLDENRFFIPTLNTQTNRNVLKKKKYSPNDVDYIASIYEGQVYLIPLLKQMTGITLSYNYPENGLKKLIHIAENFKIENIL